MKRILSLILVLVLVLGSMPLAFADEHEMTPGEKLQEYGLVLGDEEGNLMEDETFTRAQMMVMLARLYDVEDEAMAYDLPSSFSDVADDYYAPFIAYAEVQGWTDGVGDGLFAPDSEVGAQMVATFMLRILGYDVDWENAVAQAAVLGIMDDEPGEAFTRANAFDMMLDAVNTKMANEDMTLGQKLGVVDYEDPTVAVDVEVEDITANNLKQAVVEFNTAVDEVSATDKDNYDIVGEDDIVISDISLADDMTAVITFEVAVKQQSEYDVTVMDVLDVDEETEVVETTMTVEALDNTIPTAVSAEVIGIDTIKVTFSEPVIGTGGAPVAVDKNDFEVNDGDLYIKGVTMSNNDTEANVELYSDLSDGMVTIKALNTIEDFAGFSVMSASFDIEVVEDTEAPYVVSYKDASKNGVTLVFNEDIEIKDDDVANFYHTNSGNKVDPGSIVDASVDGKELSLEFTENNLPEGVAYVYVKDGAINDLWDNENDTTIKTVVEITIDETAPTLVDIEAKYDKDTDEYTIDLEFSEAISDDTEADNFTILDDDGDEIDNIIDSLDDNDKDEFLTLNLDDELNGDYTLVIEDVEDLSANAITTITKDFFVEDLKAPLFDGFTATLYNAGGPDQMVKVNFGESMDATDGKYSVDDLEKYTIDTTVLVDYTDASINMLKDDKSIEINLPYDAAEDVDDTNFEITSGTNLKMMRVADAAGNYTKLNSGEVLISPSGKIAFTAEAVDTETIEVTFTDTELAVFESSEFMITDKNTTTTAINIAGVSTKLNADGETVAVFTIDDNDEDYELPVNFEGKVFVKTSIAEVDIDTRNEYNEKADDTLIADIDDSIAPALALVDHDNDGSDTNPTDEVEDVKLITSGTTGTSIQLTFAEDLDVNYIGYDDFSVQGVDVVSVKLTSGNIVTIVVDEAVKVGDTVTLDGSIRDDSANKNKLDDLSIDIQY